MSTKSWEQRGPVCWQIALPLMIVDQCPSLTYAENAKIACTLDKIGRISRSLIIEQSLWTPTRATPTPRARSNGRVERFCLVHKLHFDEHYIIAKNSSSRDSVLAKLGQNNQCTVVDSMESPTVNFSQSLPALCDHGEYWSLVIGSGLGNQYVTC
jgi:hypothetical protein